MSQNRKIGSNNTVVISNDDGSTSVILYSTEVVRRYADKVIFNHGGYATNTTLTRMNQACNQWDLGLSVSFARGKGGVYDNTGKLVAKFVDGKAVVKW